MTGRLLLLLLLLTVSIFSIWSSLRKTEIDYCENKGYEWEQYDPSYFHKYQSIQDILDTANQHFDVSSKNSIQYFNFIADIIRKRFYHGYSTYTVSENYLAAYAGKLFWNHLSCIVLADDIMKYPMAACSQQAIVLAEIFKACKTNYRKIAFPGHFCIEAFIEGEWRYFDTNLEPHFAIRQPLDTIVANHKFTTVYSHVAKDQAFIKGTAFYSKGQINEEFAPNAKLFHRVTRLLSSPFAPFSVLLLILILQFNSSQSKLQMLKKSKKNDLNSPEGQKKKESYV